MLNKSFLGISLLSILACFSCEKENMLPVNDQGLEKTEQVNGGFRTTHLPAPDPCIPNIGSLQYFHIENFSLGSYSHSSAQEGYSLTNTNLDLEVGETYSMSVDFHAHNTSDVIGINVWLDTNLDGVFSSDELIKAVGMGARPSVTTPTELDFNITIPSIPNAAFGINTVCRVMLYYKGNAVPNTKGDNPCSIESGEVQDYSVNLYLDESGAFGPNFRSTPNAPIGLVYCTPSIGGTQAPYSAQSLQYSSMERLVIKDVALASHQFQTTTFTDVHNSNPGYSQHLQTGIYFTPGKTYEGTLDYFNHNSNDVLGFRIWVDWNKNGAFEANEIVTSEKTTLGQSARDLDFKITVPNNIAGGTYRMRTMLYYHGNAYPNTKGDNPCGFESGEMRDYRVGVFTAVTGNV